MFPDEFAVPRWRWHLAALDVELKLLRLGPIVRAQNSGQLRLPAGRPDGGQWTREDNSENLAFDDDARLIRVGDDDQSYTVDLRFEEGRGGHTLGRHVGKSADELFESA